MLNINGWSSAAHREYMALQGISHEGIVRADDYGNELLARPAVVFRHGRNWQRLDHFMASTPREDLPIETRVEMVRELAEALDHAHRRRLHHRALAPRSVYVEMDGKYPRLGIADWQVAEGGTELVFRGRIRSVAEVAEDRVPGAQRPGAGLRLRPGGAALVAHPSHRDARGRAAVSSRNRDADMSQPALRARSRARSGPVVPGPCDGRP